MNKLNNNSCRFCGSWDREPDGSCSECGHLSPQSQVINLTQHPASAEQRAAGVVNLGSALTADAGNLAASCSGDRADVETHLSGHDAVVRDALNFSILPSSAEIKAAAEQIAAVAAVIRQYLPDHDTAMIGGAPFLMAALEAALRDRGITPVYAFSRRESVESVQPDGTTVKTAVFRHLGFVEV